MIFRPGGVYTTSRGWTGISGYNKQPIQSPNMYGKAHRRLHDNQRYMGNITGNTGYLLRNVDAGTQEFAGTGNHADDGQTTWTDESQMMTSRQGRTSQSHK